MLTPADHKMKARGPKEGERVYENGEAKCAFAAPGKTDVGEDL